MLTLVFCVLALLKSGTLSASELLEGALLVGPVKDGIPQVYWPDAADRIVNPANFDYIINPDDLCRQRLPDVFILAIVHTSPQNLKKRMAIRETWASQTHYNRTHTVVVFAMGQTDALDVQQSIEKEAERYGDILQGSFHDSYRNLTYKGILWLRWTAEYCPQAHYVLKVDDDIFVNIFNLVAHIGTLYKREIGRNTTCMCLVWYHMQVMRDVKNKWFVSPKEWPLKTFPRYCSGSAFILSRDLIPRMAHNALRTKFFWVDDFYITGLLLAPLNTTYISLASLYVLKANEMQSRLIDGYAIFGHVPSSINKRYQLWHDLEKSRGLQRNADLQLLGMKGR